MTQSPVHPTQSPEQSFYFAYQLPATDRLHRFCVSEPDRHDFFMAYTFKDVGIVRALDEAVRAEGFKSWIGNLEALVSRGHQGNVHQGIQESDGFVLLVADDSLPDDLKDELLLALELNKFVVFLARRPLHPDQLQVPQLEELQWSALTAIDVSYSFKKVARLLVNGLTYVRLLARAQDWEQRHYANEQLLSPGDFDATQSRLTWIQHNLGDDFVVKPVQQEFLEASRQYIKTGKRTDYSQRKPPDIFISYCSKDRDFVKHLAAFLREQELGIWIDWENIPVATNWRNEVAEGIRAAHTLLFVISSHSVLSEYCKWELDQARQCGRRIIPLCCDRGYDHQKLEDLGLAELSYVSFEELGFNTAAEQVITAIRTDLKDVKTYNRLYGKAYEWHTHQRNARLLMERKEFQQVHSWLRTRRQTTKLANEAQLVPLHPLQKAFVEASRQELKIEQRQRLLFASLILAGFGATLLIAAYARLGEVRAMVASLTEKVGLDGLITALHAGKRLESNPYLKFIQPDLPLQATLALHEETLSVRELNRLSGHHRAVFDVAFSPISTHFDPANPNRRQLQIVSGGEDTTVRVWSLAGPFVKPLQRHEDSVVATDFSSDGDFFVTSSYDGSANVWSCAPGFIKRHGQVPDDTSPQYSASPLAADADPQHQPCQWIKQLPDSRDSRLFTVAVSPGSQYVAAGGGDGYVRLWKRSPNFFDQPLMLSHEGAIYSLAFNLHKRVLVAADREGLVKIWNIQTGTLEKSIDTGGLVLDIEFSPDGNFVLLGGEAGLLQIWDWQRDGENRILSLKGHENLLTQVAFSPKQTNLASADIDGVVNIWSMAPILKALQSPDPALPDDYEPIVLRGHVDGVNRIRYSPDGRYLATASLDDTIRLWIAADGALLDVIEGHQDEVMAIAFSPFIKRDYYNELEVGDYYLASSSRDGTIRLWRVNNDVRPLPHTNRVFDVAFSPDGQVLASSGRKTIRLWRLSDYSMIGHIGHQEGDLYSVSYSNDETVQLLAVGDSLGRISLWRPQISTSLVYKQWQAHESADDQAADEGVYAVQFSPSPICSQVSRNVNTACLASGGADGWVKFWSTQGELLGQHRVGDGSVTGLSFTQDGTRLAVSTRPPLAAAPQTPGQIYILKLDHPLSGQVKIDVEATTETSANNHEGGILTLAFHPQKEGELISGGEDGTIRHWKTQADQLILVGDIMDRHSDAVTQVDYNPDGTVIASSSHDGTVKLWHARRHTMVSSMNRHERLVAKALFSPRDTNLLASAGFDNQVLIWELPSDLSAAPLDRLAKRGCTSVERYINAMLVAQSDFGGAGTVPTNNNENPDLAPQTLKEIKRYCAKKLAVPDNSETAR